MTVVHDLYVLLRYNEWVGMQLPTDRKPILIMIQQHKESDIMYDENAYPNFTLFGHPSNDALIEAQKFDDMIGTPPDWKRSHTPPMSEIVYGLLNGG